VEGVSVGEAEGDGAAEALNGRAGMMDASVVDPVLVCVSGGLE